MECSAWFPLIHLAVGVNILQILIYQDLFISSQNSLRHQFLILLIDAFNRPNNILRISLSLSTYLPRGQLNYFRNPLKISFFVHCHFFFFFRIIKVFIIQHGVQQVDRKMKAELMNCAETRYINKSLGRCLHIL